MTRPKIQLPATILIVVGLLVWVFTPSDVIAYYEATYTDSAHGNPTSGVNRSEAGHDIGDCANCHDTFSESTCGENQLMLFEVDNPDSQTDNFCFQCHASDGAAQQVTNYTYSKNFGGGSETFTTIYDAFNPTIGVTPSSHNLKDMQDWATGKLGFTSDNNPCTLCHHPHTAQDNYPVTLTGRGGVKTAIRDGGLGYRDRPTNLWGDEDYASSGWLERTRDVTNRYQAPYYVGGSNYEPANDTTADGSNLPNFTKLCYDCHNTSNVYSTERGYNLEKINWATGYKGDQHGTLHSTYPYGRRGYTIAPYGNDSYPYILCCTDCHEPHGSPNEFLLRTCVNGKDNITVGWNGDWWEFCTACHVLTYATDTYHQQRPEGFGWQCDWCHGHGNTDTCHF